MTEDQNHYDLANESNKTLVEYSPNSAYFYDNSENDELSIERRSRKDIVYNLSPELDIDILSEELLHKTDISDIYFETILECSKENRERIENSIGLYIKFIKERFSAIEDSFIEFPKGNLNAVYNRLNISEFINDETMFVKSLGNVQDPYQKYKMVEKHCLNVISTLRDAWYGVAETHQEKIIIKREIKKMILNIRNFLYATDLKNINNLYLRLLSVDTITVPQITIMKNNAQDASKTVKSVEDSLTNLVSLHDMKILLDDEVLLANFKERVEKVKTDWYKDVSDENLERTKLVEKRINDMKSYNIPVMYSVNSGTRPSADFGNEEDWNGMQAFDLDIKMCATPYKCPHRNKTLYKDWIYDLSDIERFKHIIHETLSKYSWYICTKTSLSGKGLHIITKIKPFPHLYKNHIENRTISSYWFKTNYTHKYSIIRWVLLNECKIPLKYINAVIDASMNKITQGIVMLPDPKALWNNNFLDLPIFYGFHVPPKEGIKEEDWILNEDVLKNLTSEILKSQGHETMSKTRGKTKHRVKYEPVYDTIAYKFSSATLPTSYVGIKQIDETKYDSGGRNMMRVRAVCTLAHIYNGYDEQQIKSLARHLLKVNEGVLGEREFESKWKYGLTKRFLFDDMINILRDCGCDFDIESTVLEDIKASKLHKAVEALRDADVIVNEVMPDYSFSLPKNKPYLGEITEELLDSLNKEKVNVVESAAGSGKTTLFNNLAREHRVCLVAPFTTILSNKIEFDPVASQLFDVFYGNKQLKFENGKSVAMTFDKFQRMTKDEYRLFDIIAIDESHLLFTSAYRSLITTGVAKNVKRFIEQDMSKTESMKLDIGHTSVSGSILEDTSLFKTMSNSGVKIVLMTGTITGELLYYRNSNVLNYIKVNSKHKYGKTMQMVLVEDSQRLAIGMASNIAEGIREGKTIICPTNKGNEFVASLLAQVNYLTKGMVKDDEWIYYKKENSEHPICKYITEESKIPKEVKIIFCSLYLSVGVDILSEREYSVIVDGDSNTAQDIEQYNNRIRRSKISCKVFYNAMTVGASGLAEIKKSIYSTPSEIVLKNVSEHTEEISDDRIIAQSNKNINRKDDYNSSKLPENLSIKELYHNTSSKGVEFNEDKFLIDGFTKDYYLVSKGAAYTKYVLSNYYGYKVNYQLYSLDAEQFDILKEIGKEATKRVIEEKMEAFVKTIDFIVNNSDKMSNKSSIGIASIRTMKFDLTLIKAKGSKYEKYQDKRYVLEYPMNFEDMFKDAYYKMMLLMLYYTPQTASKILKGFISKSNRLNKAELKRTITLLHLIVNAKNKDIPLATVDMYNIISEFLTSNLDGETVIQTDEYEYLVDEMSMRDIEFQMQQYADIYYKIMGKEGIKIKSIKRRTEMSDKGVETLKTVFKVRKQKDGYVKLKARILPNFEKRLEDEKDNFDKIMDMLRGTILPSKEQPKINVPDKTGNYSVDNFGEKTCNLDEKKSCNITETSNGITF